MVQITLFCKVHNCWLTGYPLWERVEDRADGKEVWSLSLKNVWCPGLDTDRSLENILEHEVEFPRCSVDNWDIAVIPESP